LGRHASDFAASDEEAEAILRGVREQGHWQGETTSRRPDGSTMPVQVSAFLVRSPAGGPIAMMASFVDLTSRMEAEREVRLLSKAIDTSQNAIAMADLEGRLTYVNEAFVQLWGYTNETEVTGRHAREFLAVPDHADDVISLLRHHGQWAGEMQAIRKDDTCMDIRVAADLVRDRTGQPQAMLGSILDISQQKHARQVLEASEARLREAQRLAQIGSWELDLRGNSLTWSDETFRILELDRNTFGPSYEAFLKAIHPADRGTVHKAHAESVANRAPYDLIHRLAMRDGRIKWVRQRCETFYDEDGRPLRSTGTVQDVTERKHIEEQLRHLNETLEERVLERTRELDNERSFISTVLDIAGALVVVLDPTGHIVRFNRACQDVTGYQLAEIHERPIWNTLIPPEERAAVQGVFTALTSTALPSRHDNHWLTKAGDRRLIAWSNSVIKGDSGRVRYVIATGIDITERKQAEDALVRAKEEAERASRAKSEFLSRMSHELRTPMNAILGFSQVLDMEPISAEQHGFVHEVQKAGEHLLELINELLDLAQIEAGRMTMVVEPVSLRSVIEQAVGLVQPLLHARKLTLLSQCEQSCTVLADRTRLRQILLNLLANAAKYNRESGSVRLHCEPGEDDRIRLCVTDTGAGIEPDKLPRLFHAFERLGAEDSFIEGTGIGLALSRQLAELMGATLGVDSVPGRGSTFWIDLTVAPEAGVANCPPEAGAARAHDPEHSRVLYVEDNAANLRVVEAMLRHQPKLSLLSATTAEHGLQLAERYLPQVILLDIQLPDRDGYAVLRALRENPKTRHIPVLALSADAMPIDIERGLGAGFRRYLAKPVKVGELLDAIGAVLKPGE
jgi:PAS domain S-box-containing protein